MSVRMKLGAALVVVAIAIGILIYQQAAKASTDYLSVTEIVERGLNGKTVTVSGNVVEKTIAWDETSQLLRFSIEDKPGGKELPVTFHGTRPDEFSSGWPVIITGHLSSRQFYADQLLIKCPSKYSAKGSKTYQANA